MPLLGTTSHFGWLSGACIWFSWDGLCTVVDGTFPRRAYFGCLFGWFLRVVMGLGYMAGSGAREGLFVAVGLEVHDLEWIADFLYWFTLIDLPWGTIG